MKAEITEQNSKAAVMTRIRSIVKMADDSATRMTDFSDNDKYLLGEALFHKLRFPELPTSELLDRIDPNCSMSHQASDFLRLWAESEHPEDGILSILLNLI